MLAPAPRPKLQRSRGSLSPRAVCQRHSRDGQGEATAHCRSKLLHKLLRRPRPLPRPTHSLQTIPTKGNVAGSNSKVERHAGVNRKPRTLTPRGEPPKYRRGGGDDHGTEILLEIYRYLRAYPSIYRYELTELYLYLAIYMYTSPLTLR